MITYLNKMLSALMFFFAINIFSMDTELQLSDKSDRSQLTNSVEHKNDQLDLYLNLIRHNLGEKIGILEHILKNKSGVYLEIGAGGDAIAQIMQKIPTNYDVTVIASDIDPDILVSLPKRHTELVGYINNNSKGPKLLLKQLNAINMKGFSNRSLSGINASAVVHEIISYAGGHNGMNSFFKEAFRVLKDGGVLVYRDPEGTNINGKIVKMHLTTKHIKLFTDIFLTKFLDTQYTSLKDSHGNIQKVCLYDLSKIYIEFFNKKQNKKIKTSFTNYLTSPMRDIDFNKEYTIYAPRGLCREIERHYLTFLHQCNPLSFVKSTYNKQTNKYDLMFFAQGINTKLDQFASAMNIEIINNQINASDLHKLNHFRNNNTNYIESGISISYASNQDKTRLLNYLDQKGFNKSFTIESGNSIVIDYRVFGILYPDMAENLFDKTLYITDTKQVEAAKYLKREGEEYYFYFSPDELISHVGQLTMKTSVDKNGNTKLFLFCPVGLDKNIFIERTGYTQLLNSSISMCENDGTQIKLKDGKRIIHFVKIPAEDALAIYLKIIESNPKEYVTLSNFVKLQLTPRLLKAINKGLSKIHGLNESTIH